MDLLTLLLRLPLLPLQGFLRLGELIDEEVQRELRDPARLRHDLEQIQQALESGQISEEEAARAEEEAVTRFTQLVEGETAVTKL
jgi:ADP-ribose pyrophosphatase YjhB (NUDIX family)